MEQLPFLNFSKQALQGLISNLFISLTYSMSSLDKFFEFIILAIISLLYLFLFSGLIRNSCLFLSFINSFFESSLYIKVASLLDKLAKKNVIHKNKAANQKSKLAKVIAKIGTEPKKVLVKKSGDKKPTTNTKKSSTKKK
jgi:hypothetical protein